MSVDAISVNGTVPSPTATNIPTQLPTATQVVPPTSTKTPTSLPPTKTNTATKLPTSTKTPTNLPPTKTFTATAIPPTATKTATPVQPTNTSLPTSVPPTNTSTAVPTSIVTATTTPVVLPTNISTATPVTTSTPMSTPVTTATAAPTTPATGSYFVDSVGGSDTNTGTSSASAWKSISKVTALKLSPGNVVSFKRGSKWTGNFVIDDFGTSGSPIVFTAYGTGTSPIFENPGSASNKTRGITINADYIRLDGLLVRNTQDAGVYIATGSDNVTVQNTEISNTGIGVTMRGLNNKVLHSNIHDLHMVTNTSGGDDDYGAVGFLVAGTDGEIAYNQITNCKAPSYDYGVDGGTVEFYGTISGYKIHHNYAANNQGFIEIGSGSTGSSKNNTISYNVMYNNARPMGLHLSGGFGAVVDNLKFENNTVIDLRSETTATGVIFLGATPTTNTLIMRNNIFYLTNYIKFANGSTFTHDHNIFFFNGKATGLGFTLGTGESVTNPSFTNLSGANYELGSSSPAIDKGITLGYSTDYSGDKVPNGTAPDLGAYEK